MRNLLLAVVLLAIPSAAYADSLGPLDSPAPSDQWLSPAGAQSVSLTTTLAGLGLAAYYWHRAQGLEDGMGRVENQLTSFGVATLALGIGPSTGQIFGGNAGRGSANSAGRVALLLGGTTGIVLGAIATIGCTDSCSSGDQVPGMVMVGVGSTLVAATVAWAAYDLWTTPSVLRRKRREQRSHAALLPFVTPHGGGMALTLVH